jgi:DNA-binding protein WhiA
VALTADVKDELARIDVSKTTVRAAELATILRFAGGLHVISNRIAVEAELDSALLGRRVRARPITTWFASSTGERPLPARPDFWMRAGAPSAAFRTA